MRQWTVRNGTIVAGQSTRRRVAVRHAQYSEPVARIRPHRVLAINRGERGKAIRVKIEVPAEQALEYLQLWLMRGGGARPAGHPDAGLAASPADPELALAAADAYTRLLAPAVERDVRNALTEQADAQAIRVFGANLKSLLLTPPIRGRVVMGVDPAYLQAARSPWSTPRASCSRWQSSIRRRLKDASRKLSVCCWR